VRDPKRILEKILGDGKDLDRLEETGESLEQLTESCVMWLGVGARVDGSLIITALMLSFRRQPLPICLKYHRSIS